MYFQIVILINFALHYITLSFCQVVIVPFILIITFLKSTLIIFSFLDPIVVITLLKNYYYYNHGMKIKNIVQEYQT
jgi:hypothetical protein